MLVFSFDVSVFNVYGIVVESKIELVINCCNIRDFWCVNVRRQVGDAEVLRI